MPGDNFNRANALDLGASWDAGYTDQWGANTNLQIVGNRVRATTASRDATETYTGVALSNNQWAQVTVATVTGTGAMAPRLLLRFSAPGTKAGYEFALGRGGIGFTSRIGRWNAGVFTQLAAENSTAWVAGDVLRAEADGTTLRLYRNNGLVLVTTDAVIASGRAGITIYAATIANVEVDDFSAGNLTAVPDTTSPTTPGNLTGTVLSGTQISLSWPASTDNVGVTGYQVERCQGVGCTAFVQIATPTTTSYIDPSVAPGVSYSYRVRARDAAGNFSAYSPITTATPTAVPGDNFNRANALDLGASWDAGYTDQWGANTNLQIVGNRVRATTASRDATETYTGVALSNNQWAQVTVATVTGTGAMAPRLLLRFSAPGTKAGYEFALGRGGIGFTSRIGRWNAGVFTQLAAENSTAWVAGDVLRAEADGTTLRLYRNNGLVLVTTDAVIASGRAGITIYAATIANVEVDDFSAGNLTAVPDTTSPTTPGNLTGTVLSGTQISLSWPASTDNVGVTGYQVERCQGVGCTAFVQIATPTTTSYIDPSVAPGVSYSYRVRARDAAGNFSAYSPITTATPTAVPGDNFNRANALDLGASWDAGYTDQWGANTNLQIVGNRVRATTASRDATETYTGVALSNNQWAQVTVATVTGTGAMAPRLLLRFSAPGTKAGYEFALGRGGIGFTSRIGRWNAGVFTQLAAENSTAWVAGDVLRAEADGTTLRLYRNNGLVLVTTDAVIASGRAGITIYAATIADVELDDFSAGNF